MLEAPTKPSIIPQIREVLTQLPNAAMHVVEERARWDPNGDLLTLSEQYPVAHSITFVLGVLPQVGMSGFPGIQAWGGLYLVIAGTSIEKISMLLLGYGPRTQRETNILTILYAKSRGLSRAEPGPSRSPHWRLGSTIDRA